MKKNKDILTYLMSIGYTPYRKIYNKNYKVHTLEKEKIEYLYDFSSMRPGGLCVFMIKDNIEIIYGLRERGRSHSILYPRPKINIIKYVKDSQDKDYYINYENKKECDKIVETELYDASMHIVMQKLTNEEIINAMFNKDITIVIDTTLDGKE